MAPTPSPILVPSGRLSHRLRHQARSFSHHPLGRSSGVEQSKPRDDPGTTPQASVAVEGLPPAPVPLMSSVSVALTPEPSAIPIGPGSNQSGDVPGNIVAAVVLIVLILGGLIGLVIGGEMLRRQVKIQSERGEIVSPPSSVNCLGRRKSNPIKSLVESPRPPTKIEREKFPHDEKTLTPLSCPRSVHGRNRQRRLSDIWPVRSLSRVLYNRRPCAERVVLSSQPSAPAACPQTTWSEFSPVTLYVPPQRTVLDGIPEEREEDCQSQTNSDFEVMLGVTFERSLEPGGVVSAPQADRNCQIARDEDSKSLGSSAPDMTSDGDESSRSSMASLESLGDENDRESLREEIFELRRAQTRSMQMNRGVLLSLSLKNLDDNQNLEPPHAEKLGCGPSASHSAPGAEACKDDKMSLAMFGGSFSAVSLDELPSPPSILPMIPSLVSGF